MFLVFSLTFLIRLLLVDGFAVNPDTGEVFMQPYKYFMNLIEMPIVLAVLLIGVVGVLFGIGCFQSVVIHNGINALYCRVKFQSTIR